MNACAFFVFALFAMSMSIREHDMAPGLAFYLTGLASLGVGVWLAMPA